MGKYTVAAVSQEVRDYTTQYGNMKEYRVKFKEGHPELVVKWSRKEDSPAPKVGDEVEGTIDMSGEYGPKFKQDFSKGAGGFKGGYRDPVEPYIGHAAQVAAAIIANTGKLNAVTFKSAISAVLEQGKKLHDESKAQPALTANPTPKTEEEPPQEADTVVDDIGDEPINIDDIPF